MLSCFVFLCRPDREAAIMSKYYDGVEFPFCDEFSKYEKMAKIGQGTFGWVCVMLARAN